MQLTVLCPAEWKAVSNGIDTRYEYSDGEKGKRIIEKHNINWFLDFYDKDTQIAIYDFE